MAAPHTHLVGIDVWTRIIRKGEDIGYLHRNKYYDFNYQNNYLLDPYVNFTQVNQKIFLVLKVLLSFFMNIFR